MISRKNRFRGHKSLDYTYRHGKSYRSGSLGMKTAPSRGQDYRLAVVVSKKISKSAVKRNRIRRRIFEQFRQMRAEHNHPIKHDIIVTVFSDDVATMPSDQLTVLCKKLFQPLTNT
ncbi:MAG TPA: ribonuclease P protein component [Patescibacteria group bacterium]|nr:ribonuclease P protein component [Patescibacteria group bacterium]